jgi:cell division protein FtsZ
VEKNEGPQRIEWVLSPEPDPNPKQDIYKSSVPSAEKSPSTSAASGGYLARPSNIYAEESPMERKSVPEHTKSVKDSIPNTPAFDPTRGEDVSPDMQLVFREKVPPADEPGAHQPQSIASNPSVEDPALQDDADDPKRRAAERINKLRNLSFNINAADPNNEFETVPAYIRRNLELYNTISNVENFYSNYEVKTDENNNAEISTINTFLDGKRPD